MVLRETSEESVLLGLLQFQQIQLFVVDAVLFPKFLTKKKYNITSDRSSFGLLVVSYFELQAFKLIIFIFVQSLIKENVNATYIFGNLSKNVTLNTLIPFVSILHYLHERKMAKG